MFEFSRVDVLIAERERRIVETLRTQHLLKSGFDRRVAPASTMTRTRIGSIVQPIRATAGQR
ncbi:MAG: hypothetical protein E4H24_04895 [Thermomicrobiales bacterium]|nr:MAG: hypothetical protein E4H24_04895 [Thermomicrobiales bacterium]